jgi:A/G-specific adenine glycosylase
VVDVAAKRSREATGEILDERTIRRVRERLLRWGRVNFRHYPWRDEQDPWLTLVAEFLLQRTRASQVETVFLECRERYPTAEVLVDAGPSAAAALTDRLGLHRRGPMLAEVAETLVREGVPRTMSDLLKLPGVGMYTAGAWLSLHRGKRAVIIDANVARWLSRMTGMPYNRDPRHVHWVQTLAERLTPRRVFRDYNYAVLDFTMEICKPKIPSCHLCPLASDCLFARSRTEINARGISP